MKSKTLIIYALGPVGAALIGLITLPILTWLHTPEIVGNYGLLNIGIGLISLIFALGFDQSYVREFYNFDNHPELLKHCVTPGFLLLTILLFILSIFYFTDFMKFSQSNYGILSIFFVLLGYLLISNLFIAHYFRMEQNALLFSLCQFLPKFSFMIFILGFYFSEILTGFMSIAVAQFAAVACLSFIMLIYTRKVWIAAMKEELHLKVLSSLFKFGFPLVFANLTFWGLTSMNRLALSYWADMSAVGIFSVAASLALAASVIQVVFSAIWSPIVYRWEKEGIEKHTEQFDIFFAAAAIIIFAIFCVIGAFAWLVDFILPEQYYGVKYILICCFAYPLFFTLSEITVVGLHLSRKSLFVVVASCIALLINFLINLWLTPKMGISGAAIATALSFYLLFVLRTEMSAFLWRPFKRFKTYAIGAVMVLIACLQALSSSEYVYWSLCWITLLIFLLSTNRNKIKTFLNMLKTDDY